MRGVCSQGCEAQASSVGQTVSSGWLDVREESPGRLQQCMPEMLLADVLSQLSDALCAAEGGA